MKTNNSVLMLNVMSHRTSCDDKVDCSHDGCSSGPVMGQMCLDCS